MCLTPVVTPAQVLRVYVKSLRDSVQEIFKSNFSAF